MRSKVLGTISLLLLFAYSFSVSLPKGGRWDLYQALYLADKGIHYPDWANGDYSPGTPYFPGVSFLLRAASLVAPVSEFSALVLASLVTTSLIFTLAMLSKRLDIVTDVGATLPIYVAFSIAFLNPWIGYSGEFKPDSLALLFFSLGLMLITGPQSSLRVLAAIPFFLSLITKQQIAGPFAALFVALLVLTFIFRKGSITALLSLGIAGGAAVFTILLIPGALGYTVIAHAGRGFAFNFDFGYVRVLTGLAVLLGLFLFNRRRQYASKANRSKRKSSELLVLTSVCAAAWFGFGALGAINVGGNSGNLAAGALLLLPLVTLPKWIKNPAAPVGSLVVILLFTLDAVSNSPLEAHTNRTEGYSKLTQVIAEEGLQSIAISSDSYLVVRDLELDIIDLGTWGHLAAGNLRSELAASEFGLVFENQPDGIVCVEGCLNVFNPADFDTLLQNYKIVDSENWKTSALLLKKDH